MNNQKKAHRYTIVFIYMFFTIVPIVKSATKLSGNVTNLDGTNLNEGIFNITNCAIVCPFPQQTIKYTLIANGKFELYLNSGYYQAFISTKEEKYTGFFPLIIQEDDKNIKIKVRLTTIHPQPLVNLPQVKFVKGKKNHQEIYDLCNSIRDYQRSVFTEIDNKNLSAPEKYLIPIKNLLISKFQLTDNPALCEYSALLLTELHSIYYYPSQEINLDSSIVAQILAKLSPANSSWSLTHFSTFSEFIERNQIKNTFFLIDKFFQENSDRTIKSQALFKLAQYFQDINDIEKNRYYYDKIKSDYDD
ncbi:hypothetical protein JW964_05970, partial [candidate division KSB1 bacterium]|nr:hypothetical protein [candidate division KSB1 bacterium]